MSDKPLDCVGLPLTAQVGKHDFRRYATTNAVEQPAMLSKTTLDKAIQALKRMPPAEDIPDHAACGKDYWRWLQNGAAILPPTSGMLNALAGLRVIPDESLPPGICEFRNKDGKVLARLRLEP